MLKTANFIYWPAQLGHRELSMTQRYAHLSPDHIEVRELSPDSTGWPQLPSEEYGAAPRSGIPKGLKSDWLTEGVRR